MSEGTKIINDTESLEEEVQQQEELEATKLGAVSDFEKEIFDSEQSPAEQAVEEKEEVVAEAEPEVAEEKSELELLLEEEKIFDYADGDLVTGVIRSVEKGGVLVDFQYKSDGFVSNTELGVTEEGKTEPLEEGQQVKLYVERLETREGYAVLSRRKAQIEESWDELIEASKDKRTLLVDVQSKVQGGLVSSYKSIKGFIPASQLTRERSELDEFVGKPLEVVVIQVDRRRKKVIFSHKISKVKMKKEAEKLLDELEVGQIVPGAVTSIKEFGVFVDLGGIEGLVHISELSWSRVRHPSDFVDVGDSVKVFVLGVDKENRKISLGMKQLEKDPWVEVAGQYSVGDIVDGTITRLAPFGAFIRINDQIEGLIHISELSYDRVEKVEDVVQSGQAVKAKIIKLISDEQKIGLTLKGVDTDAPEAPEVSETTEAASEESEDVVEEAVEVDSTQEETVASSETEETT